MAQRRTHDWASLFEEQKKSGKTVAQFCEEKKIHQNLWKGFYIKTSLRRPSTHE